MLRALPKPLTSQHQRQEKENVNIADHIKTTGHNIKWDHFDIRASGKTEYHCKIKEESYLEKWVTLGKMG